MTFFERVVQFLKNYLKNWMFHLKFFPILKKLSKNAHWKNWKILTKNWKLNELDKIFDKLSHFFNGYFWTNCSDNFSYLKFNNHIQNSPIEKKIDDSSWEFLFYLFLSLSIYCAETCLTAGCNYKKDSKCKVANSNIKSRFR